MKQLKLRLPDELHAALVQRAAEKGRSLNSEIVDMCSTLLTVRQVTDIVIGQIRAEKDGSYLT